jgi:hypothetical protein
MELSESTPISDYDGMKSGILLVEKKTSKNQIRLRWIFSFLLTIGIGGL